MRQPLRRESAREPLLLVGTVKSQHQLRELLKMLWKVFLVCPLLINKLFLMLLILSREKMPRRMIRKMMIRQRRKTMIKLRIKNSSSRNEMVRFLWITIII